MNMISNTLISLESDPDIKLSVSITTILNEEKFEIKIGETEHELSIETIDELLEALHKFKYLSNNVN
jgi:hypothetical protein